MSARGALIEAGLEAAIARIGDPAPAVFERLAARMPDSRAMFVGDASGAVRGEMLQRAIEAMLDLVGDDRWGATLLASERINHAGLGVPPERFAWLYDAMHEVCREAAGEAWTGEIEHAWRSARVEVERAAGGPSPAG